MKTPTRMQRSSALSRGITPASTESTTARATAAWAGPNICTACFAPLIVTLLKSSVSGFAGRFGVTTASSVVKPSLLFVRALQNAVPAGPVFEPMIKSMCATSLPSPTRDSPRKKSAMSNNSLHVAQPLGLPPRPQAGLMACATEAADKCETRAENERRSIYQSRVEDVEAPAQALDRIAPRRRTVFVRD